LSLPLLKIETRRSFYMRFPRFVRLAVLVLPLSAACKEDNEFGLGIRGEDQFSATLSGANVRPSPVVTTATATASFTLRDPEIGQGNPTLVYAVTSTSLTSARAIDIHAGGSAVSNGLVLATLFTNPADTALTAAQIVSGAISTNAVVGVSFDSLVALMKNGTAYFDVHSTGRPSGLIRGQISRTGEKAPGDRFVAASLAGSKERPTAVLSTASGSATFEQLPDGTVRFKVDVVGLTGATMTHIHHGVADSAGPIAVPLPNSTTSAGPFTGTLASGAFGATNITLPGVSLDSLLSLMRLGRTYVDVHTELNKDGEIRAQIEPVTTLP
jgi:hypothetical protein